MGFSLGGIFKSLVNPMSLMQLAMGPAGWASLAMKTIGMAIAQQLIQQLGQKLGLPPAITNMAQQAFSSAMGMPGGGIQSIASGVSAYAQQMGLSPREEGNLNRQSNKLLEQFVNDALEGKNVMDRDTGSSRSGKTSGKGGGDSFLIAFAKAMGASMDKKMTDIMAKSKEIDAETKKQNGSDGKYTAVTGTLSAEMQGMSQELSMISQAMSTALKSMGEAVSTVARKG